MESHKKKLFNVLKDAKSKCEESMLKVWNYFEEKFFNDNLFIEKLDFPHMQLFLK